MLELTLPDMTCGHCKATVEKTVLALDGQAELRFDLPQQRVAIQTRASEAAVRAALTEEGYPPADA